MNYLKRNKMNKQNFFYPKKNNWDIGWPCSPRLSSLLILGMVVVVLILANNI